MGDSCVRASLAPASVPIRRAWLSDHIKSFQIPVWNAQRHRGILSCSSPRLVSKQTADADAVQALAICRVFTDVLERGRSPHPSSLKGQGGIHEIGVVALFLFGTLDWRCGRIPAGFGKTEVITPPLPCLNP